jgi:hypothetical protein
MEYDYYKACSSDDVERVKQYLPYLQDEIVIKGLLCCSFYSKSFLTIVSHCPKVITDNILTWVILTAPSGLLKEVLKHKQAKLEHFILCVMKGSLNNLNLLISSNPSLVLEHLHLLRKLALDTDRTGIIVLFQNSKL